MFSLIGYGLLGIVVAIGVVALLVLVLPGDHLAAAPRDVVPSGLPARPEIRADDVTRVRLPVTLRGYRMVDTDAILDRLAVELLRRDEELVRLRQAVGVTADRTGADRAADWPGDDRTGADPGAGPTADPVTDLAASREVLVGSPADPDTSMDRPS